jgi:hypothetical protein
VVGLIFALTMPLMLSIAVSTHERRVVGQYRLTIGWGDEPAFTGFKNFVSVSVSDAAGMPVKDLMGSLAVEITFGGERRTLPLRPDFQRPNEFRAPIVPTRSGTYTFHITGTLNGQPIETTSTCSEQTFDCVAEASDVQFPIKDPSAGQLAESVTRALPRVESALEMATVAQRTSIAAIAVVALALAAAIGLSRRGRRKAS